MNNGFPLVTLGEILTKSKEQVEIDPYQQYKQVTIKLWGQGVVLRDEVAGVEIAGAKRFVVRPQQFILSRIDARNGAFGLVPDLLDGAVVSNDFPAFTPNPSRILPVFLGWMSKTPGFVDLCRSASEGTTNRVRLKEDRFMVMKIPLPPLPEQRRIVARIEELAARIEEARRLRRQAVEEANALGKQLAYTLFTIRTNRVRENPRTGRAEGSRSNRTNLPSSRSKGIRARSLRKRIYRRLADYLQSVQPSL